MGLANRRTQLIWSMVAIGVSFLASMCGSPAYAQLPGPAEDIRIVDVHAHPMRNDRKGMDSFTLLRGMDAQRIDLSIFMPPPFPPNHRGSYGMRELSALVRQQPARLAFLAGGESLNPMIQATRPDEVTPEVRVRFEREADAIVQGGAVGFGEFAVEHFSSGRGQHPYLSSAADHPLLMLMSDIAARTGLPVDLHMEAVPFDMPFPGRATANNPKNLRENIKPFERLLVHNRQAKIIWSHAGWDLSGERTPELMRGLLRRNENLFMSIKIDRGGGSPFTPDGKIKGVWLTLLAEFADRFMIGSDNFYDDGLGRAENVRRLIDALPSPIAQKIANGTARRIFRLSN